MEIDIFLDSGNRAELREWLAQRISPRRKGSHWTELNIRRCEDLEKRGLMTGAGRKAMPQASVSLRL